MSASVNGRAATHTYLSVKSGVDTSPSSTYPFDVNATLILPCCIWRTRVDWKLSP
jgi:hypothetical protein